MKVGTFLRAGSVACVASCLAAGASAQTAGTTQNAQLLSDVVVTANRVETQIERVPAQVTVIDRAEMELRGHQTIADALRSVPGVTVMPSGGIGQQTSVFVRGSNSDHVLVLVDGIPVNDPSGPGAAYNFGDDLLGDLERIEVLRGPASSLYGSNAIGGVINLITRNAGTKPVEFFGQAVTGTQSTFQGQAGVRGRIDGFDYMFSAEGFTTDGENNTPSRLATSFGEDDGATMTTLTGKMGYDIGTVGRVDGLVRYRKNEFDLDSVPNDDPNYTGENEHLLYKVGAEAYLLEGDLTSRVDIGQSRHDRGFTNRPDANSVDFTNDTYQSVRSFVDFQNTYRAGDVGALRDTVFVIGTTAAHDTVETETTTISAFGPFSQSLDASTTDYSLYTNLQTRLGERLDLTAGLRYEMPGDYDEAFTYRLGAVFAVPEILTRFTGAIGTAFKAPTLFDRFGVDNFGFRGNRDLRPEESFTWELGFETTLPVAGRAKAVSFGATYFNSDIDDLITNDFAAGTMANVGKASIEGVESFVALRPADWIGGRLSHTWMQARNDVTGQMLARRPRHQGSLSVDFYPTSALSFGPEILFIGARNDVTYDNAGSFQGTNEVGSYTLVNLSANYELREDLTLFGKVNNLFDRDYEPVNGYAARGLTALVGVRTRF
ncbi:MAG: TonB-dependent receptor [Alphaproteobacteria bacterium]|nr:TonB-dependent receptor [Alphaproteobacteria bacterium]MBU0887989.1 TonB-dependent receptor [Alphaproteobacteria bacterium]